MRGTLPHTMTRAENFHESEKPLAYSNKIKALEPGRPAMSPSLLLRLKSPWKMLGASHRSPDPKSMESDV